MTKDIVPYSESLELKELGFDKWCYEVYEKDGRLCTTYESTRWQNENPELVIGAPLYQQAFRWFREKYNLKSWIQEHTADTFIYEIRPHKLTDYKEGEVYVYKIHEEAELACLNKLIEIIKNERNT